jgi:serine/threonine protein kinase
MAMAQPDRPGLAGEESEEYYLSVKAFFAAPTIHSFLYRALYTDCSEVSFAKEETYSAQMAQRFSQIYTSASNPAIRRSGLRRLDRSEVDTPDANMPTPTPTPTPGAASEMEGNQASISPSSRIIGRFHDLLGLETHRHFLTEYVDVCRGKRDRIFLVAEHFKNNLRRELHRSATPGTSDTRGGTFEAPLLGSTGHLRRLLFELLVALEYLHTLDIVHRNLSLDCVQLDDAGHVRLADYGMYYISQSGLNVLFPLSILPRYMAPEVILSPPFSPSAKATDIWSFGIICLELFAGHLLFGSQATAADELDRLAALWNADPEICQRKLHSFIHTTLVTSPFATAEVFELIGACLTFQAVDRPSAWELVHHPWVCLALLLFLLPFTFSSSFAGAMPFPY